MADYPQNLIRACVLPDGTPVTVRPIRANDAAIEQDFVRHLSEDARYFRFMAQLHELSPSRLKYFTEIDYYRHLALLVTVMRDDQEVEIGVARYVGLSQPHVCEFAIVIDDAWQGQGVGKILMESLIEAARERGFKTMQGTVLSTNQKMLSFLKPLGFVVHFDPEDAGTLQIERSL